jgi:transcription antitermination factor NusG
MMKAQGRQWYIISMQGIGSRGILQIQSLLDRLGYPGLLWSPSSRSTIIKYGKVVQNDKPLFSSYAFINTEITDSKLEQALMEAKLGHFLKLPGEVMPTPISLEEIEHIKQLEEINAEPIPQEIVAVEVGNLVEVCVGPFMGIKGIINEIRGHTAVIETIVFGRSAPVSVNIAHLSKLTEGNPNEKATPKV